LGRGDCTCNAVRANGALITRDVIKRSSSSGTRRAVISTGAPVGGDGQARHVTEPTRGTRGTVREGNVPLGCAEGPGRAGNGSPSGARAVMARDAKATNTLRMHTIA